MNFESIYKLNENKESLKEGVKEELWHDYNNLTITINKLIEDHGTLNAVDALQMAILNSNLGTDGTRLLTGKLNQF